VPSGKRAAIAAVPSRTARAARTAATNRRGAAAGSMLTDACAWARQSYRFCGSVFGRAAAAAAAPVAGAGFPPPPPQPDSAAHITAAHTTR